MATMDVFNSSAFSMTSLSGAVEKMDYVPNLLGSLNIFEPMPVRTRNIFVDKRESTLTLVPESPLGSAPEERQSDDRSSIALKTRRLAKGFTMYAHEVDEVRAFNGESELEQVQAEYLRKMSNVRRDIEATHELHRLGALQGILVDASGSTTYSYFTEFAVTQATQVNFALGTAGTDVRKKCADIIRAMERSSKGAMVPGTQVHALCGDTFYDQLIDHPKVRDTYLNFVAAQELRAPTPFRSFSFGGITFHNYRGTDDNSTIAVGATDAKFFPVGARDVFKVAYSPAEFWPFVNTPGQSVYAMNIPDRDRQAWTRGEMYSYPLYFCQRPEMLQRAINA